MLDGDALRRIVDRHQPDFIVTEIEVIRTENSLSSKKKVLQLFLQQKRSIIQWIEKPSGI